jgi:hypothetical protein
VVDAALAAFDGADYLDAFADMLLQVGAARQHVGIGASFVGDRTRHHRRGRIRRRRQHEVAILPGEAT